MMDCNENQKFFLFIGNIIPLHYRNGICEASIGQIFEKPNVRTISHTS